jgi:hypothetical protein
MVSIVLATSVLACAGTTTQMGNVSQEQIRAEEARQKAFVISTGIEQERRLLDVGFPLLRDARLVCADATGPKLGITFASARAYSREWQDAARAVGISDTVTVIAMAAESPTARAGMRTLDRILGISDKPVRTGEDGLKDVSKLLDRALEGEGEPVRVHVFRGGAHLEISILPEPTCAYDLFVIRDEEINAFADGKSVYVTTAMMRFASDDDLATVLSHEIAHNAMGHIQAKKRNTLLAGLLGAAIDIAAATQGVNTHGDFTNQFAALGAMTFSQDFEREADYVGMYVLALNNRPLDNASNFWRRMAIESPGSITFARSHPTTAERYIRLEQAAAEINAKLASGRRLAPEFKKDDELEANLVSLSKADQRIGQGPTDPEATQDVSVAEVMEADESIAKRDEVGSDPPIGSRVYKWAGRASLTTEIFRVSAQMWRVFYSVEPIPGFAGHLRFEVYRLDDAGYSKPVFSHRGTGNGGVDIQTGPGLYFIKVFPSNADWHLSVQQ